MAWFTRDRLIPSENDDPLLMPEQFIVALQYIASEPRHMRFYKFCIISEFHDDVISECKIRKRIGLNDDYLRKTLKRCIARNVISSQTNIELALIVFHAFFSGVIKNWLMDSNNFNLYKQAPALV